MKEKCYVDMVVMQYKSGVIKPLYVVWDDQKQYKIDKILNMAKAANLNVGGRGIKYTCKIQGYIRDLYLENGKWFLERDV